MTDAIQHRRRFLLAAAGTAGALLTANAAHAANVTGAAGPARAGRDKPLAPPTRPTAPLPLLPLLPVKQVRTDTLDIGYHEAGPADGRPVILLHGFPYDIHSYAEVAPMLAKRGYRVLVPYLRGHGSTRFLDDATPRTGQQAALGQDLIDFMDALHIPEAVLAGYDWGGRAACVMAALKPTRVVGLVAVNGYLIDDIAKAALPAPAKAEAGGWQQFYFLTERGRAGLAANRDDIARLLWEGNSPSWHFDGPTFLRSAQAFRNPDYVEVVIHAYRHRLGHAEGFPDYADQEARLAALPAIRVPTISMDGTDDGAAYAADGNAWAAHFSGPHKHLRIPGAGHNLPQEAPQAFAAAVAELARTGRWRT